MGGLLGALAVLGLIVSAGATGPASGSIVSNAAQAVSPFTAGTPFSSGQTINVVVPANSIFSPTLNVNIVECSAPNGVVPTQPGACDGNTVQGSTILPSSDGSFTYTGYQLYALPDSVTLGEQPGGVACGNTAATECILYIGNNQLDFTQPHYWSAPFYIATNASDDGANPGDGSPPAAATAPDPTLSTAVASPSTLTANGADQSTVTVTLLGTGSVPVQSKTVSLTASSATATVSAPSPAQTDANGKTTFTVTDTVAETVTLTATDTSDSITLTQKPSLIFQTPVVDASHSSVTASPDNPPADGSTPTTITVTLRDQGTNPQPVAGQAVTLSGTGSATIIPATPVTTDASGVATYTATDATAEQVVFTATDTTSNTPISNKATVTFGTLTVSASASTVTVGSPALVGSIGTTATVTLLSASNSPVAGKTVSLTSSGSATVGNPSPAVTGADGKVSFLVTDSVAEQVTLTATDQTDGVTLGAQPKVTFQNGGSVSPSTSTVTTQATTSPADGETQTLITVVLKDQFGGPVAGKKVTLAGAPTGSVLSHPISTGQGSADPGTSDSAGTVEFDVSDTTAESVTFTATDTGDDPNIQLTTTVSITFTPGPVDTAGQGTTVVASPTNPPADGSTPTTITVTVGDHFSNPLSGKTVTLAATGGNAKIATVSGVTNAAGQATFTATDSNQEIVTFQATDVTDDTAVLAAEAVVKFGNPPAPPAAAADCSVVANPSTVPADGSTTALVSVRLSDANGGPAAGKTVTLTGTGGASTVTAVNGTSDNTGMATFKVSDTTAETVKYTANDTSDSLTLSDLTVSVTFTTASATTTTTTSSTGSTTTTTAASTSAGTGNTGAGVTSPAVSTSSAGNSGSGGSTLATTGSSTLLLWLAGVGALFVGVGTLGRRRLKGERNEA